MSAEDLNGSPQLRGYGDDRSFASLTDVDGTRLLLHGVSARGTIVMTAATITFDWNPPPRDFRLVAWESDGTERWTRDLEGWGAGGVLAEGAAAVAFTRGCDLIVVRYELTGEKAWERVARGECTAENSPTPLDVAFLANQVVVSGWMVESMDFGAGPLSAGPNTSPAFIWNLGE